MLEYTYKKALELGRTQAELLETMGAEELQYWIAYDSLQNEEYRKSLSHQIHLEEQQALSEQEKTDILRQLLQSMSVNT